MAAPTAGPETRADSPLTLEAGGAGRRDRARARRPALTFTASGTGHANRMPIHTTRWLLIAVVAVAAVVLVLYLVTTGGGGGSGY